jgi:hypothetical protein
LTVDTGLPDPSFNCTLPAVTMIHGARVNVSPVIRHSPTALLPPTPALKKPGNDSLSLIVPVIWSL